MAKKYIDAEAFFKLINTTLPYGELDYPDKAVYNAAISDMCGMLTHFPAADVQEIRRGRWIEEDDAIVHGHCSSCGWNAIWQETDVFGMPYCPNCGALMVNEDE